MEQRRSFARSCLQLKRAREGTHAHIETYRINVCISPLFEPMADFSHSNVFWWWYCLIFFHIKSLIVLLEARVVRRLKIIEKFSALYPHRLLGEVWWTDPSWPYTHQASRTPRWPRSAISAVASIDVSVKFRTEWSHENSLEHAVYQWHAHVSDQPTELPPSSANKQCLFLTYSSK